MRKSVPITVALITAAASIVTTLITSAVAIIPIALKGAEQEARDVVNESLAHFVVPTENEGGRCLFELGQYKHHIAIINVSGQPHLDRAGGAKAYAHAQIRLNGEVVAYDVDARFGSDLNNENYGSSATYAFVITGSQDSIETIAWATGYGHKPTMNDRHSCLVFPVSANQPAK